MRDIHDTTAWLCFCVVRQRPGVFSDLQISVVLHTEIKQVRAAMTRLWTDHLVTRVNANGYWRFDEEECRPEVLRRLQIILETEKDAASTDDALECSTCVLLYKLDGDHIMTQLMAGENPACVCGEELSEPSSKNEALQFATRRVGLLQVTTTSASSNI